MPPIIPMGTWNERGASVSMRPKSRCFVVAEGANTEYWYLSNLATVLSKRNLPERIEIVPIQRTGDDRNKSHPRALINQDPGSAMNDLTSNIALTIEGLIEEGKVEPTETP